MKNTTLLLVLSTATAAVVPSVYANNPPPPPPSIRDASQVEDLRPKLEQQRIDEDLLRKQRISEQTASARQAEKNNIARYTGKQLLEQPQILERLFLEALINPNKAVLPTYIQIYQQVPEADQSLIDWAKAILQRDEDLNKSVASYRQLISSFPENNFIRYQLAETLFYNQEYEAAKSQFERLRASSVAPQDIAVFDRFLNVINRKDDWNFSFSATFLNDKNLANSAEQGTRMELPDGRGTITYNSERQKGHGISFGLGADKRWGLSDGNYLALESSLYSRYYWDNKPYSDVNTHLGFGLGYSDARFSIQMTPYINKRWYGGGSTNGSDALKQYSNTYGASLLSSYWLAQSFKYSFYYNYGYEMYERSIDKRNYNGANHLLTNSIMYLPSTTQYWALSLDLMKKYAADHTNSYNRVGTRLTWGQEWPLGLASSVTLGMAKRNYREASFLGIRQKNDEYSTSVSLWHKALHFRGFTPRITWTYNKTKSNIPIYTYDKNQTLIEVNKTF